MPSVVDQATTTSTAVLPEGSPHRSRRASMKVLSRNIHQVVLGNLFFDAWYYSPYPDGIILSQRGLGNGSNNSYSISVIIGIFALRGEELSQPVPESAFKVYEWEGYVVWEIDGEREKLYCQNLSLFGKLFLEQKSVFFDTGGFKYYALTHTKAESAMSSPASMTNKVRGRRQQNSSSATVEEDQYLYQTRVLGFFSKENLSWDANNLACILIFPPFQHRQLGQLLMAVSYKLSGWEWEGGVIGGPEKPLSAMGRKSYLRFWSERIARFMMGQSADADAKRVFDSSNANGKNRKTIQPRKEEMTVKEIGDRTGMLGEDVVAALTDMGICKVMLPKRKKVKSSTSETNGTAHASQVQVPEVDAEELTAMIIQRSEVVEWAEKNGVDLISPVKEEGFLGEWALSDLAESEDSGNRSHEDESDT